MIGEPIQGYFACQRCAYGSADGANCDHPRARSRFAALFVATLQARQPGACGPNGDWHVYRPPTGVAA